MRLPGKRNCTGIIFSGRRWMNYKNAARSLAQTLLNRDGVRKNYHRVSPPVVVSKKGEAQTAEKPQDKPGLSCGNEKKKVKTKTASVKKQAKPKL